MNHISLTTKSQAESGHTIEANTYRDNAEVIAAGERNSRSWGNAFAHLMEHRYLTGRILDNPHLFHLNEISDSIVPAVFIQLDRFVKHHEERVVFDFAELNMVTACAVRLSDNLIDLYARIVKSVSSHRRIGVGAVGMPSVLAALNLPATSKEAWRMSSRIKESLKLAAYRTSVGLAAEKGVYSSFDLDDVLQEPAVRLLPKEIRDEIAVFGLRNAQLFRCPLSADE